MSNLEASAAGARRSAKMLMFMGSFFTPVLAAAVGLSFIGNTFLSITEPEAGGPGPAGEVAVHVANFLPGAFLVFAIWNLVRVFGEYAEGRYVSAAASKSLQRAGAWGLACFFFKMLIAPFVTGLVGGEGLGGLLDVDALDAGLLAFAAFVLTAGNQLESAATSLKAENDEIV